MNFQYIHIIILDLTGRYKFYNFTSTLIRDNYEARLYRHASPTRRFIGRVVQSSSNDRDSGRRPPFPLKTPTAQLRLGGRPLAGVIYTTEAVCENSHFQSRFWGTSHRLTTPKFGFMHCTDLLEQDALYRMSKFQVVNFLWDLEKPRFRARNVSWWWWRWWWWFPLNFQHF